MSDLFKSKIIANGKPNFTQPKFFRHGRDLREAAPPNFLYKYFPPNNKILKDLRNGEIWLSDPKSFNDIYDAQVAFDANVTREEMSSVARMQSPFALQRGMREKPSDDFFVAYRKSLLKSRRKNIQHAKDFLRIMRKGFYESALNCGMTCFSEDWDNELMWSHYADSYEGFVVKFETARNKVCWDVGMFHQYVTSRNILLSGCTTRL